MAVAISKRSLCRHSVVFTCLYFLPIMLMIMMVKSRVENNNTNQPAQSRRQSTQPSINALSFDKHYLSIKVPSIETMPLKFKDALTTHASKNRVIILALTDSSFMDMTMNFYESSITKFGITNYLFVALNNDACDVLRRERIQCYMYQFVESSNITTLYGSEAFRSKTNIRTLMLLEALESGFTVLHTDVDVVFMKNPLTDIRCGDCDIAPLWDNTVHNAGFLYIRPTSFSVELYTRMKIIASETNNDDQSALNQAINDMSKIDGSNFVVKQLPLHKYRNGKSYFELGRRQFAGDNPCTACVVVHNNWIVSKEAKRYRFRETHLWVYDGDKYYSDTSRKYLVYYNTKPEESNTLDTQISALRSAMYIGHLLNRTVILPRFHCGNKECSLHSFVKISVLDEHFSHLYRESTFLGHKKVPLKIRSSLSDIFRIKTDTSAPPFTSAGGSIKTLSPSDPVRGASKAELVDWFGAEKSMVLRFTSLYGVFRNNVTPVDEGDTTIQTNLRKAFVKCGYNQL